MRSRLGRTAAVIVVLMAAATLRPEAQTPAAGGAAPFDIIGFIDEATVQPADDGFSGGGTITVNGQRITVPKNTLLQMPAFALTWQEVFAMAPADFKAKGQSGLAKADRDAAGRAPVTTYEVRVQGNRLKRDGEDEEYIAGLIFIAQQSLNAGSGFINYIDYATGELRVGGTIGDRDSGARVVINDPAGKFGRVRTHDARFTIDEDNPTVRAETGYPMCVPRWDPDSSQGDDPDCPQTNRLKGGDGNFLTVFTMDPPAFDGWVPENANGTNPLLMAPFEVGDMVDYSGSLVQDGDGSYISAHSVVANVGIFTAPFTQPTYVAIDVVLLGTGGIPDPALGQEATVRSKIEGFTTDPMSLGVDLFAVDVDPCTGLESERYYATAAVDEGPPLGRIAGRWRWVPTGESPLLPPTRNIIARSWTGVYYDWMNDTWETPAGLAAGEYLAPNFEFIFPENRGIGTPPVPANFQDLPFLAAGSGPYYGALGGDTPLGMLGPLSPWPGASTPITPSCTDAGALFTPVADAGVPQSVRVGDRVTLDAGASRDPNTGRWLSLSYDWTLVDGPKDPQTGNPVAVTLGNVAGNPAQRTFTVPAFFDPATRTRRIPLPYTLTFEVTVNNGYLSSSATVAIEVSEEPTPADTISVTNAVFRLIRDRLDVSATSTDPDAVLTLQGWGVMSPGAPAPVVTGPGTHSISIVGVYPQPLTVTVVSSKGGTATIPVTVK